MAYERVPRTARRREGFEIGVSGGFGDGVADYAGYYNSWERGDGRSEDFLVLSNVHRAFYEEDPREWVEA